jgi:hypothetical protein
VSGWRIERGRARDRQIAPADHDLHVVAFGDVLPVVGVCASSLKVSVEGPASRAAAANGLPTAARWRRGPDRIPRPRRVSIKSAIVGIFWVMPLLVHLHCYKPVTALSSTSAVAKP